MWSTNSQNCVHISSSFNCGKHASEHLLCNEAFMSRGFEVDTLPLVETAASVSTNQRWQRLPETLNIREAITIIEHQQKNLSCSLIAKSKQCQKFVLLSVYCRLQRNASCAGGVAIAERHVLNCCNVNFARFEIHCCCSCITEHYNHSICLVVQNIFDEWIRAAMLECQYDAVLDLMCRDLT